MNSIPGKTVFIILELFFFSLTSLTQDLTTFSKNKSSVHGNLSATAIAYGHSGIEARKAPFSYILSGNLNVNLKGFVMPFSFVYSDRNKDFRQPFNQFGLSPKYKWITLHLGYRNITFSKYVLGGHTFFGAGVELNPGIFRFGAVYGRLQRQTNQAIKINNPLTDTLQAFKRKMLSFKIGLGTDKTFVDLIVLKAKDDSSSLDSVIPRTDEFPAENIVAGINSRIKFSKRIHLEAEGAYSIFTSNINSDVAKGSSDFFHTNISTQFYLALRGSLVYKTQKGLMFAFNYRRVDPEYKSMGIYFISNDLENFTFSTAFRLLKNKLRFKGSLGLERNNLKLARSATTKKTIGSVNIGYDPARTFGININYSNYSINQAPGRIQIADSIKLYQTNSTFMVMPHFQFSAKDGKTNHFISFVYTNMGLNDKNPATENITNFTTNNIMLSYSLGLISSGLNFMVGLNYNKVKMATGESTNNGFSAGVSKSLIRNKMNVSLSINETKSTNQNESFLVFTPTLNLTYRAGKHHNFRLKYYFISNNNKTDSTKTFSEQTGDFSYVFTF